MCLVKIYVGLNIKKVVMDDKIKLLELLIRLGEITTNYTNFIKKFPTIAEKRNTGHYIHGDIKLCGTLCFTKDTLILTNKGYKTYDCIKLGEQVVTHNSRLRPVIDKFSSGLSPIIKITTVNGLTLKVTPNHPICVGDYWIEAKDLEIGDELKTLHKEPEQKIDFIEDYVAKLELLPEQEVFSLTIKEDASHFTNGILTHNSGRPSAGGDVNLLALPSTGSVLAKPVKKVMTPPKDRLIVTADYSSQEAVCAAIVSKDPNMLEPMLAVTSRVFKINGKEFSGITKVNYKGEIMKLEDYYDRFRTSN